MKFEHWRAAAEAVGLIALIGSLIFVGLQMRQDHRIALAELAQSRTELLASRWIAGIESDAYLAAYAEHYLTDTWDAGNLSREEAAAAELDGLILWSYLNILFEARRQGLVDDEEWGSFYKEVANEGAIPAYRAVYEKWWKKNPTAFTDVVDQVLVREGR